jgi:thiol-disulfide isomerase/thioredoxin
LSAKNLRGLSGNQKKGNGDFVFVLCLAREADKDSLACFCRKTMKILTILILCFASLAFADDFKAIDGKEYKNVTVSRIEPDGIVVRTKSGISKIYFVELPKDVQERFHYNAAIGAAYSAQAARQVRATAGVAGRGQPVEVISHGAQVNINQHLALGNVTIIDFYADWCGPCRQLSPNLEQMARSDPEIALRKIDIVNWKTPVARQFNVYSIPQVNVYNRAGSLVGTVNGADIDKIRSYVAQAKTGS